MRSCWSRFETEVARMLGGQVVPGSGAGRRKGDVRAAQFLCECKETGAPTLAFEVAWLGKIVREAAGVGKEPLFAVETGDGDRLFLARHEALPPAWGIRPTEILDWTARRSVAVSAARLPRHTGLRIGAALWIVLDEGDLRAWMDMFAETTEESGVPTGKGAPR